MAARTQAPANLYLASGAAAVIADFGIGLSYASMREVRRIARHGTV
jgi:hypothetical protein